MEMDDYIIVMSNKRRAGGGLMMFQATFANISYKG